MIYIIVLNTVDMIFDCLCVLLFVLSLLLMANIVLGQKLNRIGWELFSTLALSAIAAVATKIATEYYEDYDTTISPTPALTPAPTVM